MHPSEIDLKNRETLHALEMAAKTSGTEVVNTDWQRAYLDLAHAANVLDAFVARSCVGFAQPNAPGR